jgi:hypothetical protein
MRMLQEGCWLGARAARALWLLCALVVWALPARALEPRDVPAPLQPWVPWVLEQLDDSVCPKVGEDAVCVWPGRLELDLSESGGRFRLSVQLDRRGQVELPGGDQQWPQDVAVDGRGVVVLADDEAPVVTLGAGQHALEGSFVWRALPETLRVPQRIALLELSVNGRRVAQAKRDEERLWLRGEASPADEAESLTVEVFRKLDDEVPFRVQTKLVLNVSGKSRELRLPTALLPGSLPIELDAQLPARIEPGGELRIQVYPGHHELQLWAIYAKPPERLHAPSHAPPGPSHEIWVFVPHGEYRQTEIKGGLSVDPQRTNLPTEWRGFAAYQLDGGGELSFETLRRGQPQPPPNRLSLQRELWLDLDGQGYTVRDHLTGTMEREWRLDLSRGELGHAAVSGVDQLITVHPVSGARGIELRRGALDLIGEWRLEQARGELPAVAWSENVDQLGAQLHLPPGWQLLGVNGADSVSESWLSRWDLFAVFFVLVVAVAVAKLDRWAWGALALLALFVAHGEPDAPQLGWVAILLCIALLQALPAGRFRQLVRVVAVVSSLLLLGTVVSFGVSQIRAALYPQIGEGGGMFDLPGTSSESMEMAAPVPAPEPSALRKSAPEGGIGLSGIGTLSSRRLEAGAKMDLYSDPKDSSKERPRGALLEQDPNAQIQTGPGVPGWSWRTWHLGWSGPVEHTHTLQLYLLSPAMVAVLSVLRIALLGLLTFWALRRIWAAWRRSPPNQPLAGSAPGAAAALVLASLLHTAPARAELPTPELLQELKERIQTPRACEAACLQVPRLSVTASGSELRLSAELHAAERSEYRLPGPVSSWTPGAIELDGRAASALLLGEDGYLHVRLEPGLHRLQARGAIAGRQLTLDPGTPPRWVAVDAPGWEVSGLSESGKIDGSLGLVKPLPADGARGTEAEDAAATLPSWSQLTRTLSFGVSWTVSTELSRMSPRGSLIAARVPLLPGERVTSSGVPVENGVAVLRLGGDEQSVRFESVLEPRPELTLTAAEGVSYSERWGVQCSPIFRCEARDLAPIQHVRDGSWEPLFAPWPGEKLTLSVARPAAAQGQTATIDSARLELRPGVRLLRAELSARARASTQTSYELGLPEGSEVDQLSIDGKPEPIRQEGSKLALLLAPGQHELHVGWQQPGGLRSLFRTPRVQLGAELINAEVSVQLPEDRWLLAAGGPGWGPAILFWGHLVLILLLAPVLARLPRSPLRTWQWALLSLGLTQVPLPVAGLIFAWFFLMAFQDRERPQRRLWFNARQFLLLALTLAFLGCLFGAVYDSLLETPDMRVAGAGSSERLLRWYVDRTPGALPEAWALSLSLWVWRGVMLAWALWLANSLVSWLKWAWRGFSAAGVWKA